MKALITFLVFVSALFALPEEFDKERYQMGEQVFENKCSACHEKSIPMQTLLKNFLEDKNQTLKLKAPTGNQISFRLKQQVGSKDDIEFHIEETADFIVDYVNDPDLSKTICLKGVISHFDTMPSLKGTISEDELRDVAFFLYFLEGFNGVNKFYNKEDEF